MSHSPFAPLLLVAIAGCSAADPQAFAPAASDTAAAVDGAGDAAGGEGLARQIIYRATLVLSVVDLAATDRQIREQTAELGGYLAEFRENRTYGAVRTGHWTVRIPSPAFDSFLDATAQLGVSEQRQVKAEDVTEEYVDLSARLKNKQHLESRLLEIVAKRSDDIKDVLAAEAELGRVREEIERLQGRLRLLSDQVRLTTVTITAYERQNYRPAEATFAGRVSQTFLLSLDALGQFGETCVIFFAAALPWLAVLALFAVPLAIVLRRRQRKSQPPIVEATAV